MDNANNNNLVKDIMAGSGVEIDNPQFNTIVINKIMRQKKQRFVVRYIVFCSLFIAAVSVFILLLLNSWQPQNTAVADRLNRFAKTIFPNTIDAETLARQSIYLLLPLGVLLLLKKIIDLKFKGVKHFGH